MAARGSVRAKQGISSPSGKTCWGRGTVWNILRNPAYMGQAAYGRRRVGERRTREGGVREVLQHAVVGVVRAVFDPLEALVPKEWDV